MRFMTKIEWNAIEEIMWSLGSIASAMSQSSNARIKAGAKQLQTVQGQIREATGGNLAHRKPTPTLVCLCGSTRFWKQFQEEGLRETLEGKIVLSVGAAVASDEEHFGHMEPGEKRALKARLDELHLRKIDLADEVLILNLGGYIGESTAKELVYAQFLGKTIRYLEPTISEMAAQLLDQVGADVDKLPTIEERPSDEEIKETVEAYYSTEEGEAERQREEAEFAAVSE